jgi:hypothetical protein
MVGGEGRGSTESAAAVATQYDGVGELCTTSERGGISLGNHAKSAKRGSERGDT